MGCSSASARWQPWSQIFLVAASVFAFTKSTNQCGWSHVLRSVIGPKQKLPLRLRAISDWSGNTSSHSAVSYGSAGDLSTHLWEQFDGNLSGFLFEWPAYVRTPTYDVTPKREDRILFCINKEAKSFKTAGPPCSAGMESCPPRKSFQTDNNHFLQILGDASIGVAPVAVLWKVHFEKSKNCTRIEAN